MGVSRVAATIIYDPLTDVTDLDAVLLEHYGFKYHHTAIRAGYANDVGFYRPYEGKYGYGYMAITHLSANKVFASYYIKENSTNG